MVTDIKNGNQKIGFLPIKRGESKTPRKFTSPFPQDALPKAVSVSLDWLSMMVECGLPEAQKEQPPLWLTDRVVLEYLGRGIQYMKYSYKVYLDGQYVANLSTHGTGDKIIKPGGGKLEIANHVLYSTEVQDVVDEVMSACKCTAIRNLTSVHIALDGVEHIHRFLNAYLQQNKTRNYPQLVTLGKWDKECRIRMKGKAQFSAKIFNRKNGMFDAFKIGGGKKTVVLYNKTSELERSHKEYIREVWDRSGLDLTQTIWRCELRLNSETVKTIKDFAVTDGKYDFKKLQDPNYLLQIFRTCCNNFFEFVDMKSETNVTRAPVIDLLQFEKLRVPLLERVPRALVDGAYKAKMAIHNAVKDVLLHNLHYVRNATTYESVSYNIQAALQHVADNLNKYNLQRWYQKKLEQWKLLYVNRVGGDFEPALMRL